MAADPLSNLPRLVADYTDEQRQQVIDWLADLPTDELLERIELDRIQLLDARRQGRSDQVVMDLFDRQQLTRAAVDRKLAR